MQAPLLCGLVAEMTHPREHHGQPRLVGGGDYLLVAHGTAGLGDGRDSRLGGQFDVIGEGEEGIGSQHSALGFVPGDALGQVHADHPVGLSRAHANQRPGLWRTRWHWI